MRNYETIVVFRPNIEDERRNKALTKFKSIIESDGEIVSVDEWGMKKLAYEIEKLTEGYYVLINFKSSTELPKELERNYKISDDVIRYIVVNKDEK